MSLFASFIIIVLLNYCAGVKDKRPKKKKNPYRNQPKDSEAEKLYKNKPQMLH